MTSSAASALFSNRETAGEFGASDSRQHFELLERADAVADLRRALELEVLGGLAHLGFQADNVLIAFGERGEPLRLGVERRRSPVIGFGHLQRARCSWNGAPRWPPRGIRGCSCRARNPPVGFRN